MRCVVRVMRNARQAAAQSAAIEAQIAQHGAVGLAAFCAPYAGETNTAKVSILIVVGRLPGRLARAA